MPSVQLAQYLQLRADGVSVDDAAFESGIGLGEAELHEADIASGELELPEPSRAPAPARTREDRFTKEVTMPLTDDEAEVTMKVGDGREVPIDLKKDLDAPENAQAKEQLGGLFAKPATDTGKKLKLFIERLENLEEERKGLAEDISEVLKEVKDAGFDKATVKRILKIRKMETHTLQEAEALLQSYMESLGMTPIETAIALAA